MKISLFSNRSTSIVTEITVIATITIIIVAAAIIYISYIGHEKIAHEDFIKSSDEILHSLVDVVKLPLWNLDRTTVEYIGRSYFNRPPVASLKIIDSWGKVYFKADKAGAPHSLRLTQEIKFENHHAGFVEIYFNDSSYMQEAQRFLLPSILPVAVSAVVLVITLIILLRLYLRRPLMELNHIASSYSAGKYGEIKSSSNIVEFKVEFKPVFSSLKEMGDKIRAQIQELQEAESRYMSLIENALEGISVVQDGVIRYANQKIAEITGYSPEELKTIPADRIAHPEDLEMVLKYRNARIKEEAVPSTYHLRIYDRNGNVKWLERKVTLITWDGKPAALVFDSDITERKQFEEQKQKIEAQAMIASRLASLGELAAGVAHEINNPITGIIGYAQMLMVEENIPVEIKNDLKAIYEGAERVADIVKRLLTFSRQVQPKHAVVNINDLIENTLILRAYQLRMNNIEVIKQLKPDLPNTIVDPGQIQQVLLNLIINAETEMKLAHGKGTLTLITETANNMIRILVRDTGRGIKPEIMEKIFDPFFTTREVGQGTGLGLSLCYGIITQHHGKIYAESIPGEGATFVVELPIITGEIEPETEKPVFETKKITKGRILVVDDEQGVCEVIKRILSMDQHEIETVNDAMKAIEKIKTNKYDAILLDIKMPNVDGITLYKELNATDPSLVKRILFITGDVLSEATAEFLRQSKAEYIEKPFDTEQLRAIVASFLHQNK